ncbi:MAG: hypothetical protein CFH10_00890 [Alphaproteobacteria bacterium MarineAlpha4_Bin2]|nr:MAG: hypothetical protein CFH10_00890 [Alphaproteobacteria bacterium MarineAlpha4_Bin2]
MALLQSLGAKSIPVVSKGPDFVFAQSIGDVAEFLGLDVDTKPQLSPQDLIYKYDMILKAAARHIRQIPDDQLGGKILDRDRTYRQLTYHIFRIAEALMDTANGGELTVSYYADNPPSEMQTVEQIANFGDDVRCRLKAWWASYDQKDGTAIVDTYFGRKPLHEVLERSTWHSGQHVRQIVMAMNEFMGVTPKDPLTANDFAGLPLPEKVWD